MSIDTFCPKCGRLSYVPEEMAEGDVLCPGCGGPVRAIDPAERSPGKEEPVGVACPNCGAPIRLVPRLVGLRVRCNTCRVVLSVSLTLTKTETAGLSAVAVPNQDIAGLRTTPDADPRRRAEKSSPSRSAPKTPPPNSHQWRPREAATTARERKIRDALRYMVYGGREPRSLPSNRVEPPDPHPMDNQVAPWFWPSVVAAAATWVMLTMLAVIRFTL